MNSLNFINKLLDFEPGKEPFVSIYLNTEANETGKKNFDVFLKKKISEQLDKFDSNSEDRKNFESGAERIRDYVDGLDPSVQGAAIFLCAPKDFFQTYEFRVPFDEDLFFVFDRPDIYPLVRLVSQNRRFIIVQADTNSAHIYIVSRGEVLSRDDFQNVKTNRTEVGGWSQMRFQRHVENFHKQHAKEVIAELERLVSDEHIESVILAGDETIIIPLLRDEMSKELSDKVIGTIPLNVHTPEYEVLEAAVAEMHRRATFEDLKKIRLLEEQNYEGGRGVMSFENVLSALLNGQVQELYISADFDAIDYNIGQVNEIFKDYSPGLDETLPSAKRTGLVIDELLRLAAGSADDIRFIEDASLLKKSGGVGALLRYQAKGVNV
jgi:peptide chain release factor subunit 1